MNQSVKLAIGVALALVIWMVSGMASTSTDDQQLNTDGNDDNAAESLMLVQTEQSIATMTDKTVVLQGEIEPFRVLQVKAQVDGAIEQLPIELGDRVTEGHVLMRQALKFRQAQRTQAKAQIKHRQAVLAGSKKLKQQSLASQAKVAEDEALLAAAQAELARIEYELKHVTITAPFAGVVDQRLVELGDFVDKGQPVVSLVDDNRLKITAMVGQHQLGLLKLGQKVSALLAGGEVIEGELTFVATSAEQATRSYRIEAQVDNGAHNRWVGKSATITIGVSQVQGHRVKTSVVGLSTEGQLQIKVVDEQNLVQAYDIEIIRTEQDSLWVSGLPQQVNLITLGQNFVSVAQQVRHHD